METRHRNHLWAWLATLAIALVVSPGAVPSSTAAAQSSTGASTRVSVAAPAKAAPRARLAQHAVLLTNGNLAIRFTSNARAVTVRYRHNGRTRYVTLRVKNQRAAITLPKGARKAQARARATKHLRRTAWVGLADRTAPAAVRDLTVAQISGTAVALRWLNPPDKDLASVSVRRTVGYEAATTPSSGTPIELASATAASATDAAAGPDTTYTYTVFTHDRAGNTNLQGAALTVTADGSVSSTVPTQVVPAPPAPTPTSTAPPVGGFPGEATTGVPAGVVLRPSGGLTITTPGTVVDGLHVSGTITIAANNVTVRRTLVQSNTPNYPIKVNSGVTGALIEDVEVDNMDGTGLGVFFAGGSGTLRRANIHSAEDGIRIEADNVTIENCYVHDLFRVPEGHHDSLQIRRGDNVTIRGNNFQAYKASTDDPMNAAIQMGSLLGTNPISNFLVEGNLMNGGNFTINGGNGIVDSALYRNNVFGRDYRYGAVGNLDPDSVWDASNTYQDNNQPVR